MIEDSLKFEQWEDDASVSRHRLRVRLQRFEFMGSPGENTEQADDTEEVENAQPAENTQQSDNAEQVLQVNESAPDDVPF